MGIQLQVTREGDWERLTIIGVINEDAELPILNLIAGLGKNVIVNFGGVQSINSCGVNAWIKFMRQLEKDRSIVFEECTSGIVSQINMTPIFRGKATINSVYADYECPGCGHQQSHLFIRGQNMPTSAADGVSDVACAKCGKTSEMEEVVEDYFAWVDG